MTLVLTSGALVMILFWEGATYEGFSSLLGAYCFFSTDRT